MTLLVHDTARNNLASWVEHGIDQGLVGGAVLSPFTSPLEGNGYKLASSRTSQRIRARGGEFWFDAMTHALAMPRAGDYRYYDRWQLWSGGRGELGSAPERLDHVARVLAIQDSLSATSLIPNVLVSYPDSLQSQLALDLATLGERERPVAWQTVAGDAQFWQGGAELDAHVGALNQLEPAGWYMVVARGNNAMPPTVSVEEILGVMRTTYALALSRPVRVAHGDLAALPAVAAGAEAVGTGWDLRQRLLAYQDFEERVASDNDGGGWYQRPTLRALMGSLSAREYAVLQSENALLAMRLTPGTIGTRAEEAFVHHATVLRDLVTNLLPYGPQARCELLVRLYRTALAEWAQVETITNPKIRASRWIVPFLQAVEQFMRDEGWPLPD